VGRASKDRAIIGVGRATGLNHVLTLTVVKSLLRFVWLLRSWESGMFLEFLEIFWREERDKGTNFY
jgi:hypothetical protein